MGFLLKHPIPYIYQEAIPRIILFLQLLMWIITLNAIV